MIKLLLDTNFLLDLLVVDRPGSDEAAIVARMIDNGRFEAAVSAGSLKDVYYVGCKYADESVVRGMIEAFMDAYSALAVDDTVCRIALKSNEPDFEDGVIRAIAETAEVDVIVTRDTAAFAQSLVRSMPADVLLKAVGDAREQ